MISPLLTSIQLSYSMNKLRISMKYFLKNYILFKNFFQEKLIFDFNQIHFDEN